MTTTSAKHEPKQHNPKNKAIRVLIVDDHRLTNECLKMGVEKESDMEILGQAYDGQEAIELAKQLKPDIVLMDVCLPKQNGIQATAAIKTFLPETKVIMTTSMMDKKVVQAAFSANADGYCTKETKLENLLQMMRTVYGGAICLDPKVALYAIREIAGVSDVNSIPTPDSKPAEAPPVQQAPSVFTEAPKPAIPEKAPLAKSIPAFTEAPTIEPPSFVKNNPSADIPNPLKSAHLISMNPAAKKPDNWSESLVTDSQSVAPIHGKIEDHLTQRELEILKLIADNNNNTQISQKTGLSETWLASHIKNILLKLSVTNEVQAIRRALHEGLIEDAPLLHEMNS